MPGVKSGFPLEKVNRLIDLFVARNLTELEYTDGPLKVVLRKDSHGNVATHAYPASPFQPAAAPEPVAGSPEPLIQPGEAILAPMTGVFYRATAPGEPAFVNVGDILSVGQTIGMIEAMKVFSEVPADKSGRVIAVLAKNGDLLEEGAPILTVSPS